LTDSLPSTPYSSLNQNHSVNLLHHGRPSFQLACLEVWIEEGRPLHLSPRPIQYLYLHPARP
jgi:hypothetical protein